MLRRFALLAVLACSSSVFASDNRDERAQGVEKFAGEIKVDKGKARPPRKLALVDASGVALTSFDKELLKEQTESAVRQLVEGLRKRGYEVVSGQPVQDAFRSLPGVLASTDSLEKIYIEKFHLTPERASAGVAALEKRDEQAVRSQRSPWSGSTRTYRAEGTVNLRSMLVKGDGSRLNDYDQPGEKDVQKRIAALVEALAVDGAIVVQFDMNRSQPKPVDNKNNGIFGAIAAIRDTKNVLKGDRARASVDLSVYGRDGKEKLLFASGDVVTKEGGGIYTHNHELAALLPVALNGLVVDVLGEIGHKLD